MTEERALSNAVFEKEKKRRCKRREERGSVGGERKRNDGDEGKSQIKSTEKGETFKNGTRRPQSRAGMKGGEVRGKPGET